VASRSDSRGERTIHDVLEPPASPESHNSGHQPVGGSSGRELASQRPLWCATGQRRHRFRPAVRRPETGDGEDLPSAVAADIGDPAVDLHEGARPRLEMGQEPRHCHVGP
jgi:hypothetical protein